MRSYPNFDSKWDREEVDRLQPEQWMLELLKLNPSYCFWGPHEDYMWKRGRDEGPDESGREQDHGWESRILLEGWDAFKGFQLDNLNECVHFYFQIDRKSEKCPVCEGPGIHPHAQWVTESWYEHSSPFRIISEQEKEKIQILRAARGLAGGEEQHGVHPAGSFPSEEVLKRYKPKDPELMPSVQDLGLEDLEEPGE